MNVTYKFTPGTTVQVLNTGNGFYICEGFCRDASGAAWYRGYLKRGNQLTDNIQGGDLCEFQEGALS